MNVAAAAVMEMRGRQLVLGELNLTTVLNLKKSATNVTCKSN